MQKTKHKTPSKVEIQNDMTYLKHIAACLVGITMLAGSASAGNIVETAQSAGKFNTLIAAAKAAGLVGALTGKGPLTVFAPTDEAFAKLPAGTVESLLKPENKQKLVDILTYHVLARKLTAGMLPHKEIPLRPLNKKAEVLRIEKTASGVTINGANIVAANVRADNGIIHIIDTVLLPK